MILTKIRLWWRALKFHRPYIIADCSDNSITLSRSLYRHMELSARLNASASNGSQNPQKIPARVFIFHIPAWNTYGFTVNPDIRDSAGLADIQYNPKYRTIGFEALCPTVNSIFHYYGLPHDLKMKLTVTIRTLPEGRVFYNIERPRK